MSSLFSRNKQTWLEPLTLSQGILPLVFKFRCLLFKEKDKHVPFLNSEIQEQFEFENTG
jgi:hypothetical protein